MAAKIASVTSTSWQRTDSSPSTVSSDQSCPRYIYLFRVVADSTLRRVLDTFREFRVGSNVFAGVDGYGHGDIGRETLDKVYARLFGAEAALVRFFFSLCCRPWCRYRRCRCFVVVALATFAVVTILRRNKKGCRTT